LKKDRPEKNKGFYVKMPQKLVSAAFLSIKNINGQG